LKAKKLLAIAFERIILFYYHKVGTHTSGREMQLEIFQQHASWGPRVTKDKEIVSNEMVRSQNLETKHFMNMVSQILRP